MSTFDLSVRTTLGGAIFRFGGGGNLTLGTPGMRPRGTGGGLEVRRFGGGGTRRRLFAFAGGRSGRVRGGGLGGRDERGTEGTGGGIERRAFGGSSMSVRSSASSVQELAFARGGSVAGGGAERRGGRAVSRVSGGMLRSGRSRTPLSPGRSGFDGAISGG